MTRRLTPRSSLENLKREAKRWLRALRENDPDARARLERADPGSPEKPGLRDVQHALAREHGFAGWAELRAELARVTAGGEGAVDRGRDAAIQELLAAANRGDVAAVSAVLDAHPDIVNERAVLPGHSGRRTALHFAINSESEAVVDLLLARGADPDVRDDGDNAMPLHFAAERGALGIVRRLIERGADPVGEGDGHELEVIGWATCFSSLHRDVADYLLAHGARHTIFSAVAMGETAAVRELVDRWPGNLERPMDRTNLRRRPLHLAVLKQRADSLDTLLALGADTEAEDAAGLTPLDLAALNGERAMAETLVTRGARVRLPAAVALERTSDIERLLRDDPFALRPGGRWQRLILRASERSPGHVIETLIRHGASVHTRDDHRTAVDGTHGYTPLHAAAFNGNEAAVRTLLLHGASPMDRDDRYWGTPAGWANHAGHRAVRDLILEGPIDIFDAILFDRLDRIREILNRNPQALDRPFGTYVNNASEAKPWLDPRWTPEEFAAANGKVDAARLLAEWRATPVAREDRVTDFLRWACLDWRIGGGQREARMHDASRLLARHPEIARANLFTAVVCGELDDVRRRLDERPAAASEIGGPRDWPPLLYLCSARLTPGRWSDTAVEMARLLLDRGADPNVFYPGGNADIHYTALTCVLGRGEEQATMHPRARDLTALLLERGADPHDNQVLYNVFADNTSRPLLDNDIVWLLELMYEHSVRRGRKRDWDDPHWPMFDMRGAPSLGDEDRRHFGARLMLEAAIDRNLLPLAEWMLAHGAGASTPVGTLWRTPDVTLYQQAVARGHAEMAELLVRHGARRTALSLRGVHAFADACLRMDVAEVRALLAQAPEYLRDHRPLFAAVERDRADVAAMLLDLGTSPDVEDPATHRRALHVAAAADAATCASLLIDRGADVDAIEAAHGSTPLGWASWYGHSRMIALLARYSRDVWRLVYRGQVERLREVLREQPELATRVNAEGDTLLMWLPSDEHAARDVAELLLQHGADPALRNNAGSSAADIADRRGLEEVAVLLRA